jgi:hypothetical protein
MSVNNRYGIDEKRVKRFGKLYSSIDFDSLDTLNAEQFYTKNDYQIVGDFCIGKHKYPITFKELDRIEETIKDAKSSLQRAYQIGLLGKRM